MERIKSSWTWLVARAQERSTWLAFGHMVIAASVYPYPFNLLAVAMSVAQAVMPDAPKAAAPATGTAA